MNVSRVAAGAWLIAAAFAATSLLLLHSGPVDAATATYPHSSGHHAFYSYDHSSAAINTVSPSTQRSRAAESSLAASEALLAFTTWRQRISSRTYYVPDVPATSLKKAAVDVYEPKNGTQDVSVYDSENAIAQVSAHDALVTDKCGWLQPPEASLGHACADVSGGADLNGLLACGVEKHHQVSSEWDVTETDGGNELLTGEQRALDMEEIDKVLAVLDEDVIVDASSSVISIDSSGGLMHDYTEIRPSDANSDEAHPGRQVSLNDPAYHAGVLLNDLLPASGNSAASRESDLDHMSASSQGWIDSLEVKNISAIFSAMERSSESIQQHEPSESIKILTGKVDSRVFVPNFSVQIEGFPPSSAPVQRTPQVMPPSSSWVTPMKSDSGFLVGPPSLFTVGPQRAPSRKDRVERWKQKRKARPAAAAPRREPDVALSSIRRNVAAKRQRVRGRFVSSGVPATASFVPITALQKA